MKAINVVALSGNLTRNPESFSAGCNLGLAVNMREKQGEDWGDRPSYFDVTVFGKQADACMEYLSKGSPVIVEGNLRQDRWQTDGGDGRSKVKVIARNVVFVGGKGDDNGQPETFGKDAVEETAPAQSRAEGLPSGKTPATEENIKKLCLCRPGYKSEDCPIEGHGVPF